jgi:hypothetical protein
MESFGRKKRNASSSSVTDMLKQRVQANLYDANKIKTRGAVTVPEIRMFKPDLNNYSAVTGAPLGTN